MAINEQIEKYNIKWVDGQSAVLLASSDKEAQEVAKKIRPNVAIKSITK